MSYVELCDLCEKPTMQTYSDVAYKFIVKKRWHRYGGFTPYREETTLDICEDCMKKIIKATHPNNKKGE